MKRLALAVLGAFLGVGAQQAQDDEKQAEAMLKRADALIEAKEFEQARLTFWYIAKKWPGTKAAETANYRGGDNVVLDVRVNQDNGPSENRIDVHIMGDSFAYTNPDQRTWLTVSKGIAIQLTSGGLLREYSRYFNCWRVSLASKEKGTSTDSRKFDTALGAYVPDAGGGYSLDGKKVGAVAAKLAYNDGVWLVLIRMGGGVDSGGGGPYGGYVMWTGGGTLTHEFGHAFGGLGDEYTSEPGGMPNGYRRPIGRGVNYSDTADPKQVPWAHWFEKPEIARAAHVGVVEGANAHEKGQWKPTGGCTMESAGGAFCAVCREHMVLQIYARVNPIDDAAPATEPIRLHLKKVDQKYKLENPETMPWVLPLQPLEHKLSVKWRLQRTGDVTTPTANGGQEDQAKPVEPDPKPAAGPRKRAHASLPFEGEELKSAVRPDKQGRPIEHPDLSKAKLEPGRYLLTAEVRDEHFDDAKDPETKQPVRVPWVVKDARNLLVERAAWELVVQD